MTARCRRCRADIVFVVSLVCKRNVDLWLTFAVQEVQVHKFVVDRMLWTGDKPTPVLESRLRNPLPSDN